MSVPGDTRLEAVIRRDRLIVFAALVVVIALSWAYLFAGAGMGMSGIEMTRMSQLALAGNNASTSMMTHTAWTPGYAVLMFVMWLIMMVAMMLPSAAPLILLFATINRRQRELGGPIVKTGIFVLGYLSAWAAFSLVAVGLQWWFERSGNISPMLVADNAIFAGLLLLVAGVYQLTSAKHACLRHCRSPLAFLSTEWRPGTAGALRMGLLHGAYCVACCWALMGLMFFGGAMNLYWIAGLALYLLFEKSVPSGHWLDGTAGIALVVAGAGMLLLAL